MTYEPPLPRAPLSVVTTEAALATVFTVLTGGSFLTGLALLWGANCFQIGLIASVPFITPVAQIGAAWLIDRTGKRRTITLINSVVARQIWWLILPFLFVSTAPRMSALIGIVVVFSLATNISTVGWTSWMADLVPENIRGKFFGTRSMAVSTATLLATMSGGVLLDFFRGRDHELTGFSVILTIAGCFALASLVFLRRTPDCPCESARVGLNHLVEPLRSKRFRHLLTVFFLWNLAIGLSGPFFAPHMLVNLKMTFTMLAAYECAAAIVAIALNRKWGVLIDRFGCKPVISLTMFTAAGLPLLWLFPNPNFLWLLIPEILLKSALFSGYNLAAFTMPIAHSPNGRRTTYLALFSMITGVAFFIASLIGGALAQSWSSLHLEIAGLTLVNYHLLFVLSTVLRLIAAFVALTFREDNEQPVREMLRYARRAVVRAVTVGGTTFPNPVRLRKPIPIPVVKQKIRERLQ